MMKPEGDGDVTVHPAELPEKPQKPVYPHTGWIEHLFKEMEVRVLTKGEVIAITEASIFESLIETTLPELREQVAGLKAGIEFENAQVFITVAADFARGMAGDISNAMKREFERARVRPA